MMDDGWFTTKYVLIFIMHPFYRVVIQNKKQIKISISKLDILRIKLMSIKTTLLF